MQQVLIPTESLLINEGQIEGLPKNPRFIKDDQYKSLVNSLREDPDMLELRELIVYPYGDAYITIGGNMRLRAGMELGFERMPCKVLPEDTSVDKLKRLTIKDNGSWGSHDWDALANEWGDLPLNEWGISLPEEWIKEEPAAEEQEFDGTPPAEPISVLGDLYELNNHRVLCGDSTDSDAVARLMDGKKADMVFTDPPYGMSYKGQVFGKDGLENDGDSQWEDVLEGAVSNMLLYSENAVCALCFSPARLDRFFKCTKALEFKRLLTIYKPNRMGYPWQAWILTSEVVALFENGKPTYNKKEYKHDVYTFDYSERPDREVNHPTVKPLSIVQDIISKTEGSSVLDLFLGSGTTLIASSNLDRTCYGMELSPEFTDVIVRRYIKYMQDNNRPFTIKRNGQVLSTEELEKFSI